MSQIIPEEIEHLDFDLEKEDEKEEEPFHHKHPTLPGYSWCGTSFKSGMTFMKGNGRPKAEINCQRCLDLIAAFGRPWYWQTHRKHYGSNCCTRNGVIYHDCGA